MTRRRLATVDWRPKVRWFAAEYLIVVLGVLTAVALNARARDIWYYPPGAERSAFSNDVPAFLRDREAYGIVMSLFDAGADMKRGRRQRLEEVRALRARIEAVVDGTEAER